MDNQSTNQEIFSHEQRFPLPNATAVLVLGIVSIVGCFCYSIVGLICSIIALVLASKDMAMYKTSPMKYTPGSYNNLKGGKVCAIIGLSMSILYLIIIIIAIAMLGVEGLTHPDQWMLRR